MLEPVRAQHQHDELGPSPVPPDLPQKVQSGYPRQADIEKQRIRSERFNCLESALCVVRHFHVIPFLGQDVVEQPRDMPFIFHN